MSRHIVGVTYTTVFDKEGSEPLASAIFALRGSRGEVVARRIEVLIDAKRREGNTSKRLEIPICIVDTKDACGEGLVLETTYCRNYSTRYRKDRDTGRKYLPIGKNLPDARVDQAAREIIAMLERGEVTWIITNTMTGNTMKSRSAYGAVASKKKKCVPEVRQPYMHEV